MLQKCGEIWQFNTEIKEYSKQERTRIRQPRRKFKIQIIPKQFSSRYTYIHSHTYNSDYNTGYNICDVLTV